MAWGRPKTIAAHASQYKHDVKMSRTQIQDIYPLRKDIKKRIVTLGFKFIMSDREYPPVKRSTSQTEEEQVNHISRPVRHTLADASRKMLMS